MPASSTSSPTWLSARGRSCSWSTSPPVGPVPGIGLGRKLSGSARPPTVRAFSFPGAKRALWPLGPARRQVGVERLDEPERLLGSLLVNLEWSAERLFLETRFRSLAGQ